MVHIFATVSQRSVDISLTYVPCVCTLQSRSDVKWLFVNQSYILDYTKTIVTLCATDSFTMLWVQGSHCGGYTIPSSLVQVRLLFGTSCCPPSSTTIRVDSFSLILKTKFSETSVHFNHIKRRSVQDDGNLWNFSVVIPCSWH